VQAIILAGGMGTRLKEVVSDVPKPMAPIGNRPFLAILLNSLKSQGFTRIILSVGYLAHHISDYFGAKYLDMDIVYSFEDAPLGTGGAIKAALDCCIGNYTFVFNGDTFIDVNAADVLSEWKKNRKPVMVAKELDDIGRYGVLDVTGADLKSFSEKGLSGPGLINAGCYLIPINIFTGFDLPTTFSFEKDFLQGYILDNDVRIIKSTGLFIDIGIPEDYEKSQLMLKDL
jgi:D-glycero-alpha-D-manno-heptose 1-phosphate guanylyltransferase